MDIEEETIGNFSNFCINDEIDDNIYNLIVYINNLDINNELKTLLINLIKNDNYNNYMDIYNICVENDIELPPLL